MIICSEFWINFWPNFASTIGGLVIGLPIALWTNRIIIKEQNRKQETEDLGRLNNALDIIKKTLIENADKMLDLENTIYGNEVQWETRLDTSAWDAVKNDIIQYLHNPNLQKRIAYHFSRLNTLSQLNSLYLESTTGVTSIITGREQMKEILKNYLITTVGSLLKDQQEILDLLNEL